MLKIPDNHLQAIPCGSRTYQSFTREKFYVKSHGIVEVVICLGDEFIVYSNLDGTIFKVKYENIEFLCQKRK